MKDYKKNLSFVGLFTVFFHWCKTRERFSVLFGTSFEKKVFSIGLLIFGDGLVGRRGRRQVIEIVRVMAPVLVLRLLMTVVGVHLEIGRSVAVSVHVRVRK